MAKKINNQFVFSEAEQYQLNKIKSWFPRFKNELKRKKVLESYIVRDELISKSVYDYLTSERILNRLIRWNIDISNELVSRIYNIKKRRFETKEKEYYEKRKNQCKKPIYYPDARYFNSFGIIVLSPAKHGDR